MLRGRLGLETARIPHADRHGLLWLSRGALTVKDGTLRFERQQGPDADSGLEAGEYGIPFQSLSMILLGPGSTVSHDALRLMARHGTALVAVGEDGVRCYTAPPLLPDTSDTARRQMRAWGDPSLRLAIARKMYALRLGEVLPHQDLNALRGVEGARMRRSYQLLAQRYGIEVEEPPLRPGRSPVGRPAQPGHQPRLGSRNLGGGGSSHFYRRHPSTRLHPRTKRRSLPLGHRRPLPGEYPAPRRFPIGTGSNGPSQLGHRTANSAQYRRIAAQRKGYIQDD